MPAAVVEVAICNRRGLHARAAAKLAALAETLTPEVFVSYDGQRVSALSIMGLMLLGAGFQATVAISAEGEGAAWAVQQVASLVTSGFAEAD